MIDINYISLGVGIIGVSLAIVFFYKSRRIKRILYTHKSFVILSETTTSLPNFSATYQDEPVTRLKASKLLVWNSGSDTIVANDFASTAPLKVTLPENTQILEAMLIGSSTYANKTTIIVTTDHMNEAKIDFEYLGKGEGFVLSVLHTSLDDEPTIEGIIKGSSEPKKFSEKIWKKRMIQLGSYILFMYGFYVFPGLLKVYNPFIVGTFFAILIISLLFFVFRLDKKSNPKLDALFDSSFEPNDFRSSNPSTPKK